MIYPEPEKGGRGLKKERVEETSAVFSAKRLQQARAVLRASPDELALQVLGGTLSLDAAHATAQQRKAETATTDE